MNVQMDPLSRPKPEDGASPHEFVPHANRVAPPLQPPSRFEPVDFPDPQFEPPPDLSDDVNEFGPFHVINNHAVINHPDEPMDIDMDDDDSFVPVLSMFYKLF